MAFPMEKHSYLATFVSFCWLQSKLAKLSQFTALNFLNRRQIKTQPNNKKRVLSKYNVISTHQLLRQVNIAMQVLRISKV